MPETSSRDADRGEELINYDVTVGDNVILLDEKEAIDKVVCEEEITILKFNKGQSITVVPGQVLAGGAEWGCVHTVHRTVLPINRRVLSVVSKGIDSLTLSTENALLTDLFSHADVKYTQQPPESPLRSVIPEGTVLGQATPVAREASDAVMAPEETNVRRGSDKLVFGEIGSLFFAGDKITVPYTFDNSLATKKFEVCLRKKRLVLDKDISCQTITLSSYGKGEITFTVQSYYEASAAYYIKFDGKGLFAASYTSEPLGINPAAIVLTPVHGSEFFTGATLETTWYVAPEHRNKVAELSLIKDGILPKRVASWQVALSAAKHTVAVDALPKGADAGDYTLRLTYGCLVGDLFCDLRAESAEVTISRGLPGTKSIAISTPAEGDVYANAARTLTVSWTSTAMAATETVKVSVCREGYGLASCPLRNAATTNSGRYAVTLPTSWKGSSNYYVVLRYNCKLFWCSTRESARFAVNYTPQIEFVAPTPARGAMLTTPTTLTAAWRLRAGAKLTSSSEVSLRLMRQVPLLELVHDGASVATTAGAGSHSFEVSKGTVSPVRFMVAFDCKLLNYFCQREYSPVFYLPSTATAGWNYDAATGQAAERKTLFAISCTEGCAERPDFPLCKACGAVPGLRASIDVACTNCYVTSTVKMYDFMLNVNMLGVTGASLAVTGEAVANIDMLAQIDAAYEFAKEIELARYPILGTSFKIGPIAVNLGISLALNTTLALNVEGVAKVTAGFDATVSFKAISSMGGMKGDSNDVSFGLTKFNTHTPTLDIRVDLSASAGIKPVFDINAVDLLRFWVALHPYLTLAAQFQVPAFRPAPAPAPDALALLGVDCESTAHYTRYDLRIHLDANMFASALSKEWASPVWSLIDKSLLSGCLFASSGPLSNQTYTLTKSLAALGFDSEEAFMLAFTEHLASAAFPGVSASRFSLAYPAVDASNKFAEGTVNILVTAFQTEDAHENIELKELNKMITNTISNFYQSDFGKKLKGVIGIYSA